MVSEEKIDPTADVETSGERVTMPFKFVTGILSPHEFESFETDRAGSWYVNSKSMNTLSIYTPSFYLNQSQ
jgi:hypothetical protein